MRDSGSGKGRPDGSSSKSEEDPSESPNYRSVRRGTNLSHMGSYLEPIHGAFRAEREQ